MTQDPRHAKTLGEAAQNVDGTYNGAKALSWLSEVLSPGRGMSEDTIHAMFTDAKRKAARQLT